MSQLITAHQIKEVTERMEAALKLLRREKGMPVSRARVIAKTASTIIDTVKVEIQQSIINREKQ